MFINTPNANGQSAPIDVRSVGTIDVGVSVLTGAYVTTLSAILRSGTDSIVQTQAIAAAAGSGGQSSTTFTINTASKNSTTGAPLFGNGLATLSVVATTSTVPPHTTSSSVTFNLSNP